jgi:hypothetical protein
VCPVATTPQRTGHNKLPKEFASASEWAPPKIEGAQRTSAGAARKQLEKSFEDWLDAVNRRVEAHERLALIAKVDDHRTINSSLTFVIHS